MSDQTGKIRALGRSGAGPLAVLEYGDRSGSGLYLQEPPSWTFVGVVPIGGHEVLSVLPLEDGAILLGQSGYISRWSSSARPVCPTIGLDVATATMFDLADGSILVSGGSRLAVDPPPLFLVRPLD
jgi:hypothetical protein